VSNSVILLVQVTKHFCKVLKTHVSGFAMYQIILSTMITIFCYVVLSVFQGIALTQLCYLYQKVGCYKMVSKHSVTCRIKNLGMDNHMN
jgi:hypothetical protein